MTHLTRRRAAVGLGIAALLTTSVVPLAAAVSPASAAPVSPLAIDLAQTDGTPDWNGQDDSATNGIVRTNDLVTYTVHLTANGLQPDTKVTLDIPQGAVLNRIPAFCGEGSTLDPDGSAFGAPVLPVTVTSWESFPQQTLVCALGDLGSENSGLDTKFDVTVKVRPEVPNGATLPAVASVTTSETPEPLVSNGVEATVAAQAQYDVSKNGMMPIDPAGGDINNGPATAREVPCSYDPAIQCQLVWYGVTVTTTAGAKGNSPANELSFVDNLDPNAFFGAGTTANPNWTPDYAPRLRAVTGPDGSFAVPGSKISATGSPSATSSVRDSGSWAYTGNPGEAYTITFTNPDLTGYTYPSTDQRGRTLPDQQRAAVISVSVQVEFPIAAIQALGTESNGVWTLRGTNSFTDLRVTDINGTGNAPGAEDSRNNNKVIGFQARTAGSIDKWFAAEPGSPGSQDFRQFNPGYVGLTGLPGQTGQRSGDAPVSAGQSVISVISINNQTSTTLPATTQNALVCDVWDATQFTITPGDYAGGGGNSQRLPSNGAAVWLSGTAGNGSSSLARVQYGVVGFTPDTTVASGVAPALDGCADDRITWYDSIAAAGGAGVVGAVRALVVNERGTIDAQGAWVSIGLTATAAAREPGTSMPNYLTGTQFYTPMGEAASLETALTGTIINRSSYVADTNVGALGDRVIAADLFSSINKQIQDPNSGAWVDEIQAFTGGQTANFKLIPSVSSANPIAGSPSVVVEDCLPRGFTITSSNRTYTTLVGADAHLQCAAGETYVRWDLGAVSVSDQLDPITYAVTVSKLLGAGTYKNTARITAVGDPAALNPAGFPRVTDTQNVQIQVLRGVFLEKNTLTPITQVNLDGQATDELTSWEVRIGNMDTVGPRDMDVIDRLPVTSGSDGSTFAGTMRFVGAEITEFGDQDPAHERSMLYYTTESGFSLNPNDPSNTAADGSVTAIWSPTLPSDPSTVTGVRLVRTGAFGEGEQLAFRIDMAGVGNHAGDHYTNTANAVAHTGLGGLLTASGASDVVASGLGDRVWWDLNRNGVQDDGEAGARGVSVTATGVDDLGNPVSVTTTTDANGGYAFPALRASDATGYTVTFAKPDGAEFTVQHAADATAETDSDADPATGQAAPVAIPADSADLTVDAGLLPFGALVINKQLTGVGAGKFGGDDTLVFHAVCTFAGETVLDQSIELRVNGASAVTSDVLGPLPAFATCDVTETVTGDADEAPAPVTVTIPWDATAQKSATVVASLTNRYSGGTLQLTKKLDGDAKAIEKVADQVFQVLVTCQVEETDATGATIRAEVYSGVVKIRGGDTKLLVDDNGDPRLLPLGTRCFGTETVTGGADAVSVDAGSFENAVVVTAGTPEQTQRLAITVVNTFVCDESGCEPEPTVTPEPTSSPTSTSPTGTATGPAGGLPTTGAALPLGVLGAGLLIVLVGMLLLRRRARQG